MKNHHEEIINAHQKNENHEEFLRKDYRQNMLGKDIIIDEIGMADEFNSKGKRRKNRVQN